MADSLPFSSSSKLVYFVVIPLILISGLVLILNRKPSTTYTWPDSGAPPPVSAKNREQTSWAPPPPAAAATVEDQIVEKKHSDLERAEASLARARARIQEAQRNNQTSYDPDYVPNGPMYRNPNGFHSKSMGILGIEGILIHHIEISKFRTRDPGKAHVFFIPISAQSIANYAYVIHNRAWSPLQNIARDYVNLISTKYPYWNRTLGHDHVMLACHDWAPKISKGVPFLFKNSIRVLCNSNTSEGFKPSVDVPMPEIYLPGGKMDGLIGGPHPSNRSVLFFYSGGIHGRIRQMLMDQWKDKDPDVQIHEYLPRNMSYYDMFRKSKYCICPSGWEVASPRTVEALYTGCVPVLLKDHYAKPFDDLGLDTICDNRFPESYDVFAEVPYVTVVAFRVALPAVALGSNAVL
ncbi:putative glycosyltransferase [Sesamum angolense]|uniref:Glycosyltransferase n=1 Tax=Sesamum angolense TaxID=2727404 RepID=A0AAE2BNT0_9LAMI|nr:putative glycosyltransferase [Sesamum angolense]